MQSKRLGLLLWALLIPCIALAKKGPSMKKLDKRIVAAYEALKPTGLAVAVVKDGEIVYKKAFGYANADTKEALATDHLFNIASCSKAFTAAGLALLVERGKVKWEDKVRDHIPEFALIEDYATREMDLKDLLCHRSGLGTFYGDLLWYGTDYSNADIIKRMKYLPMTEKFGSGYGYQNNMYMIAGEVIKKVTGKDWEQYIQETFFEPLGMNASRTSNDVLADGDKIAMPHTDGAVGEIYDFNAVKPAASIYSSVEDLAHWAAMLTNSGKYKGKQVISPATINDLFTGENIRPINNIWRSYGTHYRAYGLGWSLYDYGGAFVAEHDGGMPGYISKVALVPDMDLGIIVLNNGFDFFIHDLVRFIVLDAFLDREERDWIKKTQQGKAEYEAWKSASDKMRAESQKQGTLPSMPLISYCGTFRDQMYGDAEVRLEEEGLYLTLLPTKKYFHGLLSHWHDDVFKVQFDDPFLTYGLIQFDVQEGAVKRFTIDLPSGDFHFFNLNFQSLE